MQQRNGPFEGGVKHVVQGARTSIDPQPDAQTPERPAARPSIAQLHEVLLRGHEGKPRRKVFRPAIEVVGIGDCLAPRSVEEAVLDGLAAASEICA